MADSADSPSNQLADQFDLIEREAGDEIPEEDAERLTEFGHAIFEGEPYPTYETDEGRKSFAAASTRQYLVRLRVDVSKNGHGLTEISAEEFNQLMADLDADRARSTTVQAQSAGKHFFRYFEDLGVDPDEIVVFDEDPDQREVQPEDVYTYEEIEAIRRAVDSSVNPIRNRAFLEMLIYTGQRIRALQTLKIGDVHPEEKPGYFNLNEEADGLKGATDRGRRRPLLTSRKYVRQWKERHPLRDDVDAWFFIGNPSHNGSNPDQPWSMDAMRGMLYRAAERAGVYDRESGEGKKPNPHAFRHYWYTSMRRREGADPEDLKAVGGWVEGSDTPEQLYKNFADEEHGKRLERALGVREPDEEIQRFIPETCPTCAEPLKNHWDRCPSCGEEFTVDAARTAEEDATAARYEAEDPEDSEMWAFVQRMIMEDPEGFAERFGEHLEQQ